MRGNGGSTQRLASNLRLVRGRTFWTKWMRDFDQVTHRSLASAAGGCLPWAVHKLLGLTCGQTCSRSVNQARQSTRGGERRRIECAAATRQQRREHAFAACPTATSKPRLTENINHSNQSQRTSCTARSKPIRRSEQQAVPSARGSPQTESQKQKPCPCVDAPRNRMPDRRTLAGFRFKRVGGAGNTR